MTQLAEKLIAAAARSQAVRRCDELTEAVRTAELAVEESFQRLIVAPREEYGAVVAEYQMRIRAVRDANEAADDARRQLLR